MSLPQNFPGSFAFIDALPIPKVVDATQGGSYEFKIVKARAVLHSQLPLNEINAWTVVRCECPEGNCQCASSGDTPVQSYLGPTIVAQKGTPIEVNWTNCTGNAGCVQPLPPIDDRFGTAMNSLNGLSMHLHGGKVKTASDGWPYHMKAPGQTQNCNYPNDQPANLIWYHDHSMGWTSRTVLAGIAGGYIIRDEMDDALMDKLFPYEKQQIPHKQQEIPLVLQDRILWDGDSQQLGSTMRYLIDPDGKKTYAPPYAPAPITLQPEYFGDLNLVNGRLWPQHELPYRGRYRLRIINGCNARTYSLALLAKKNGVWSYRNDLLTIIGTDGGFMAEPIVLGAQDMLTMAPGERRDVILDLTDRNLDPDPVNGCSEYYLVNTANFPFAGDGANANTEQKLLSGQDNIAGALFLPDMKGFPQIMKFCLSERADSDGVTLDKQAATSTISTILKSAADKVADYKYAQEKGWKIPTGKTVATNRLFLIDNNPDMTKIAAMPTPNCPCGCGQPAHCDTCGTTHHRKRGASPATHHDTHGMHGMHSHGRQCCPSTMPGMMYLHECGKLDKGIEALKLWIDIPLLGDPVVPSDAPVSYEILSSNFDEMLVQSPPTEGSYERWYFVNLATGTPTQPVDMHPMHLHLVNFYCANRWQIALDAKGNALAVIPIPAGTNPMDQIALRDTVRVNGAEICEFIVYFPLGYQQPLSDKLGFPFHCHILEHAEMGMMRYFRLN